MAEIFITEVELLKKKPFLSSCLICIFFGDISEKRVNALDSQQVAAFSKVTFFFQVHFLNTVSFFCYPKEL